MLGSLKDDHAIKNVAKPPKPLKRATISGIAVIFTFRAIIEPIRPPNKIPARIILRSISKLKQVTPTAENIARADK